MPSTSLAQFMGQKQTASGDPLHWGRADIDGVPYRGKPLPAMPEAEMENRLKKVADPQIKIFDMAKPTDVKEYQSILGKITAGWATCIHVDRQFVADEQKWLVYMEWADWYMQDGAPMHSQAPYMGRPND